MWWPEATLVNEVHPREMEHEELIIHADGTVEYKEKFHAQLEAHYNLRKFPFDRQVLEIEIESFVWTANALVFRIEAEQVGFSADFEIPEWHTVAEVVDVTSVKEIRDRAPFSEFTMKLEVKRRSGFYIWKTLLPLILIVGISWSVFWMMHESLSDRMSLSFTGILTVVAYQFLISGTLPKVGYLTFLDGVLVFSMVLIVVTVLENIYAGNLRQKNQADRADNIDRQSRWCFPLVYITGLGILIGIYL